MSPVSFRGRTSSGVRRHSDFQHSHKRPGMGK